MPSQDYHPMHPQYQMREPHRTDPRPYPSDFRVPPESDLRTLIQELRIEVAYLRACREPITSLIMTGQQVVSEFEKLKGQR